MVLMDTKAQSCLYLRGWTNPDRERPLQGDPPGGSELPILESRSLADDDQSRHQVFSGDSDNPAGFRSSGDTIPRSSGDTIPNCLGEFREIRESKERTRGAKRANHVTFVPESGWPPTPMTNLGGLCLELLSGKGLESAFLEEIGLKHETVLCHHGAVFPKTPMKTRTVPWLHRLRLPPRGHLPNGHNGEPSVLSRSRVRCVSFSPLKSGNKSNKSPASTVAGTGFAGHCNPSS